MSKVNPDRPEIVGGAGETINARRDASLKKIKKALELIGMVAVPIIAIICIHLIVGEQNIFNIR